MGAERGHAHPVGPIEPANGAGRSRPLTLAAMSLGFGVVQLDVTIVNTALNSIGTSLGGGVSELQWVVSIYTIAFAALILTAGALGDRSGAKKIFMSGFAVFTRAAAGRAIWGTGGGCGGRSAIGRFLSDAVGHRAWYELLGALCAVDRHGLRHRALGAAANFGTAWQRGKVALGHRGGRAQFGPANRQRPRRRAVRFADRANERFHIRHARCPRDFCPVARWCRSHHCDRQACLSARSGDHSLTCKPHYVRHSERK